MPNPTTEIIADALSTMIGELLLASKAWKRYLSLEAVTNERGGEEMDVLVRWVFEVAVRHGVAVGVRMVTVPLGERSFATIHVSRRSTLLKAVANERVSREAGKIVSVG